MSSRGYRTSPEVSDLIRAVESAAGWSTRQGPKVVQFLHPDGEQVIRLGNTADAGDVKQAIGVLTKFGVLSTGTTKNDVVTETVIVRRDEQEFIDPYPHWSVFEKSKKVWKAARDYAAATGKPLMETGGAEFYLIDDKKLAFFISKVLPKIRERYHGEGGTREVYDYLRSTGNAVHENAEDETSLWVVRTQWSDEGAEVIIRNPRRAVSDYEKEQQRKERKLREEEVSQRLRAPQDDLVITKVKPDPEPAPVIDSDDPKAEVHTAFAYLIEAMDEFMAKADPNKALIADLLSLGEQLETLKTEVAFMRADNEVQKRRADRAEEIIGCIRLAFDTQPMHQAAASTIDLLPPNKD